MAISEYLERRLRGSWTEGGLDNGAGHVDIGQIYQSKVSYSWSSNDISFYLGATQILSNAVGVGLGFTDLQILALRRSIFQCY